MTVHQVLLWRHGRTAYNDQNRWQGQLDVPLDEVGLAQAGAASRALAARLGDGPLRVVSSDLRRARDTASVLCDLTGAPLATDEDLREIFVGWWQGLTVEDVRERDPEMFLAWSRGDDVAAGGGERRSEAAARAVAAIRRHVDDLPDGTLVVASHGGVIRWAVMELIGLGSIGSGAAGFGATGFGALGPLRNAHWVRLIRRRGAWVLDLYNAGSCGARPGCD